MLVPKMRICTVENEEGKKVPATAYFVWDTDLECVVENRTFSAYSTKEACQEAIDFYNGFVIIAV